MYKTALLFLFFSGSAIGALTLEPLRNRHLKGQSRLFEQVDFMQTAVETVKSYIGAKSLVGSHQTNTGTGDHVWKYLTTKTQVADFLACQTCWFGAQEATSLLSNSAIKQSIESNLISFCGQFMRWSSCSGFVNIFADLIINNLLALNLRPDYLCTETVELCPEYDSGFVELNETTFQDAIMATKP
jgi:hypothetical protein